MHVVAGMGAEMVWCLGGAATHASEAHPADQTPGRHRQQCLLGQLVLRVVCKVQLSGIEYPGLGLACFWSDRAPFACTLPARGNGLGCVHHGGMASGVLPCCMLLGHPARMAPFPALVLCLVCAACCCPGVLPVGGLALLVSCAGVQCACCVSPLVCAILGPWSALGE